MSDALRFAIRYSDGGEGRTRPEARENAIDALRLMLRPEPDQTADPDREPLFLPLAC